METILSVLRFPFRPSVETQVLIERGISWREIAALLFAGATLFQLSYSVFTGALLHYVYGYDFKVDFSDFGYLIIFTVLGIIIFAALLFVFDKIFGGVGGFKIHIGVLAYANIPIAIIAGIVTALVYNWNDSGIQMLFYGLVTLISLGWAASLISKSHSVVHRFSKIRAASGLIIIAILFIVVAVVATALLLSAGIRG